MERTRLDFHHHSSIHMWHGHAYGSLWRALARYEHDEVLRKSLVEVRELFHSLLGWTTPDPDHHVRRSRQHLRHPHLARDDRDGHELYGDRRYRLVR